MLREHDVALVIADSPKHKAPLEVTASWSYVRLHGGESGGSYEASYGEEGLGTWARRIAKLAETADPIYVFFNNDKAGNAVIDGLSVAEKVGALGVPVRRAPRDDRSGGILGADG
jgi:uncharacterized protein YecE (DUF72 family)